MSVAKAKAAMTAPVSPPSNIEAARQGFFDQCTQFGTNAGAGDTSKVGCFQATVEASWNGFIVQGARRKKGDINSPPTDAELAYKNFIEARKKKAGELGKKLMASTERGQGDFKQRVTEFNRMIILGALPVIHNMDQGGLGVFNRALKIIREDDEIKGQVDDLVLEIARRQCERPDVPLTDEEIRHILRPDPEEDKPEREEVELWGNVLNQIESIMNKKFPETAGVDQTAKTARNAVVRRIDDLGGTKKMVAAREKAAAEAKQKGTQVVRQGARGARKGKRKGG